MYCDQIDEFLRSSTNCNSSSIVLSISVYKERPRIILHFKEKLFIGFSGEEHVQVEHVPQSSGKATTQLPTALSCLQFSFV